MTTKMAMVTVHGIGSQTDNFHVLMSEKIKEHFAKSIGKAVDKPEAELVIEPAWWAPVLGDQDEEFAKSIKKGGKAGFPNLRNFILNTAADAIAYQPIQENRTLYDDIHHIVAKALNTLAQKAGDKAPLCIVCHSLGTIVISNYIWDLQFHNPMTRPLISAQGASEMGDTEIEKGETLSHLYTMGSPLALWR
jgi:hypothetical protein